MTHYRRMLQTQLRFAGRCALSGMLAALLATQTFAQTSPVPQPAAQFQVNAAPAAQNLSAATFNPEASANPRPDFSSSLASSSSVTPANLNLMLSDAAAQSMAPPQPKQKRVQRPGMLVLGIAGIPLMAFGAYIYGIHTNSSSGSALTTKYGTAFFVPGAVMSGVGFYFAFHKKKN